MKFTFLYFFVCICYVFCMDFWFDENEVFCAAVKECFSRCVNFVENINFDRRTSLKICATIVSRERKKSG